MYRSFFNWVVTILTMFLSKTFSLGNINVNNEYYAMKININ